MINFTDKNKVILTFFAHPDDETLAAGATLSKLSQLGCDINVAVPATGIMSRENNVDKIRQIRSNCINAAKQLGISRDVIFGDFPDNQMDTVPMLEVIKWIENIISEVNPDIIFTHHINCSNIDHRVCHEAAIIASRPDHNKKKISILSGEVPSSTGYLRPVSWEPNVYFEVSEDDVNNKISAMSCYETEKRENPHPRSPEVLKALSKVRGSESGNMYAEAFMLNKLYV